MLLDIGTGELFVLVVLAVILLGPEKAPGLARKAARILRFLRHVANNATEQIKTELGPEFSDLKVSDLKPKNLVQRALPGDVPSEMDALRAELDDMRTEVTRLRLQTGADLHPTVAGLPAPPAPPSRPVIPDHADQPEPGSLSQAVSEAPSSANAASDSAAEVGSSSSTAKPFWIRT